MKHPRFVPGTINSPFTRGASEPSGFEDAGFTREQVQRLMHFVRLCYEEYLARSGITKKVSTEFPDEVPLYCISRAHAMHGTDATTNLNMPLPRTQDGRTPFAQCDGIGMTIAPSFFGDNRAQNSLKQNLPFCLTSVVSHRIIDPMKISREKALHYAAIRSMTHIDHEEEQGFPLEVDPVLATSGLSVPGTLAAEYRGQSHRMVDYVGISAFRHTPPDAIWRLYERMLDVRDQVNRYPSVPEVNDIIREQFPVDAARILAHPSFREATEGTHVLVFQTRSKAQAVLCPFTFSRKRSTEGTEDGWNPIQYAFSDRLRDPVQLSMRLVGEQGKKICDVPMKVSVMTPFIPRNMLSLLPSRVRKNVHRIVCRMKDVGEFTIEKR